MPSKFSFVPFFFSLLTLVSCDSSINKSPKLLSSNHYPDEKLSCTAFQSPCYIENVVGRFDIYFLSDKLKAEEPFKVAVKYSPHKELIDTYKIGKQIDTSLENLQLIKLTGYMEGKDMFMGKIPVLFEKNKNLFVANTVVSACHTNKMVWKLILTAELEDSANKRVSSLPFVIEFEASR